MTYHKNELPIPLEASSSENARELLRVWAANGQQHVSLATGLWPDPAAWGIMLVDLVKHLSSAYEKTSSFSTDDALQRIKGGFDAEWKHSTDIPAGRLVEKKEKDMEQGKRCQEPNK